MPITDNIGGVLHTLDTIHDNDGGVLHELAIVHSNDDGVLHEIHSAWKPPDTLTWTAHVYSITPTNNGYNCEIWHNYYATSKSPVDIAFTATKPTKLTVTLDNYSSSCRMGIAFVDGVQTVSTTNNSSLDFYVEAGEHTITFQNFYSTENATLIYSVVASRY